MDPITAEEGGLPPPVQTAEELLDDAVAASEQAGFTPGRDVTLCVDVAASHFYHDGRYYLAKDQPPLQSSQMIEHLVRWVEKYPIVSVEDGLAEEDWPNWPALRAAIASKALVVGDDLL